MLSFRRFSSRIGTLSKSSKGEEADEQVNKELNEEAKRRTPTEPQRAPETVEDISRNEDVALS